MGLHFFCKVGFVEGINALAWIQRDVFVIAQLAVGLVFNGFAVDIKQAIQRIRFGFMDFLNYFCGGWVFPADGGGDLLQLFGIELEALRFDRSFYRELWSNLVYGHQAIFLSDCSITCSPSWNLTLLTTRVSN
ncbi:MAG: hypothetical protein M0Q98_10230 [Pseudomonas sp.]|nr:hypothetical protein [Pseudomonas sp.]